MIDDHWLREHFASNRGVGSTALVVASHFCLLPTVWWTWRRRRRLWIEFIFFASLFFWSSLYHLCFQDVVCFLDHRNHQLMDHFFAQMAMPILILYIGCIDLVYVKGIYFFVIAQVDLLLLWYFDIDDSNNYILVSLCALIVLGHYGMHVFRNRPLRPRFDAVDAFFGFALGFAGIACYKWHDHTQAHYWFTHGVWHCLSFTGSYFVLEARNPSRTLALDNDVWRVWWRYCVSATTIKQRQRTARV